LLWNDMMCRHCLPSRGLPAPTSHTTPVAVSYGTKGRDPGARHHQPSNPQERLNKKISRRTYVVGNRLRSHLREYFPGFLAGFESAREGLCTPVARILLATAPTPEQAVCLSRAQLRSLVKWAGRQRGIEAAADRLREVLRRPQMRQPPLGEEAMGRQTLALLRQFDAAACSRGAHP
jgi:hypothetical protein